MEETTVAEARKLQNEGVWEPNPKYDPANSVDLNAQRKLNFRAKYAVHYRPGMKVGLFSDSDPAIVTEV